jgi:hypothetical protein
MEHKHTYVRISDLLKMAKPDTAPLRNRSDETLDLIEQAFRSIEAMTIAEREEVMKRLTGWMLVEKFEAKGQGALIGFQRFCIAECLFEDPSWTPPQNTIATKFGTGSC